MPEELNAADVHDDVHRVGQELQGELRLQQRVDLLDMIGYVFTDVLREMIFFSKTQKFAFDI